MFGSVPRKPVPWPVRCRVEAGLCRPQRSSPWKGPRAKAGTHPGRRRRRRRRRSTKNGLGPGRGPPSATRRPSPGRDPTRRRSTASPAPTGQHGAPGACAWGSACVRACVWGCVCVRTCVGGVRVHARPQRCILPTLATALQSVFYLLLTSLKLMSTARLFKNRLV